MADVVRRILRLHHGTQGDGLDEFLLLLTLTALHQRIEATGDSTLGAAGLHLIAELGNKLAQGLQLGGVWLVVDTVRQRLGLHAFPDLADALGDMLVGQQHKLLNKLGGVVRLLEIGTDGLARFVDIEV